MKKDVKKNINFMYIFSLLICFCAGSFLSALYFHKKTKISNMDINSNIIKTKEENKVNINDNNIYYDKPCKIIETLILQDIDSEIDENDYLNKARIYQKLTKVACPENKDKYKGMAIRNYIINNSLKNDKHLDIEKQKILEKVNKITGPMIDFLFHVEKVVNE